MTKAMQDALRLFLLQWMEVRQSELEFRISGLKARDPDSVDPGKASKLDRELAETKRISRRLAEEHYKQGGHNAG